MKKILQYCFGKMTVMVSLLCAFAYTGNSQATYSLSTANCTITPNEVQMDLLVTNTSATNITIRWNSITIRMTVPASMLPVPVSNGTYSFQYLGGSDFPASWPAVPPANAGGASFTAATRLLTWTTGTAGAYNNLNCPGGVASNDAKPILQGETKVVGRFSFKRTNGDFIAGQPANFVWSTTTNANFYVECAGSVSSPQLAVVRNTPCALVVPNACAVTGSSVVTDPNCFGGTGSAVVTLAGAGSGAPGTYQVDGAGPNVPYATNPFTVSGLSNGPHSIVATVTATGCVSSAIAANVTEPAQISGSSTIGSISCVGATDGSTIVTLSSSTSGTYTVDGNPGGSYNSNPFTVTGLGAGPHTIVATSTAGCVSTNIVTNVSPAAPLNGSAVVTDPACFGGTGSALVTVSVYSGVTNLSGSQEVPPNVSAATGSINASFNSLTNTLQLSINFIGLTSPSVAAHIHKAAPGVNGPVQLDLVPLIGFPTGVTGGFANGSIVLSPLQAADLLAGLYYINIHSGVFPGGEIRSQLNVTGSGTYTVDGGAPQSYSSNPFTISGLSNGPHTIVVTSAAGCVSSGFAANVTVPAQLSGTATGTAVSCVGSTDGTASVTLSTSTSGTYTVDGGLPQNYNSNPFTVTGLGAGPHTIVATSAAGCVSSNIGVIVDNAATFTGTATSTPTTCGNPTSGTIIVTLSGSTSGTYSLDGGPAAPYNSNPFTITGVTGGPHTVVATAAAGCVSNSIAVTVGSTAVFSATITKTNLSSCSGLPDGSITVTPNGGQAPFTYVWTGLIGPGNPSTTQYPDPGNVSSISGLTFGFYNVTVTSSGGCGSVTYSNIHVQNSFSVFVTNNGTSSSSCGNTGTVSLFGNAGVTPYTYALSPGTGQPTPAPGAFQLGNTFTGLAAGPYTGFVKDAGGCVSAKNITVGAIAAVTANPFAVASSSCNADGSIQIFKTGGVGPFTYSLDGGTYQTSNFFPGLAAGPYMANVKDANGCIGSAVVTVGQGAALSVTAFKTNPSSCAINGSIQVNATGGVAPYTYSINGGLYQVSNSFSGLAAGSYAISVKDTKGCTGNLNVTINVIPIVVTATSIAATTCASNNGKIFLFRTGGTGPFTYSIDGNNYQSSNTFLNVAADIYDGYVKDANGCTAVLNGIVVGPTGCAPPPIAGNTKYSAPVQASASASLKVNAYPNPSNAAFTLQLDGYSMTEKVSVTVTDLMGRKVYQTEGTGKQQYRFGTSFISGMYNVQVIQGSDKKSLKLVKE